MDLLAANPNTTVEPDSFLLGKPVTTDAVINLRNLEHCSPDRRIIDVFRTIAVNQLRGRWSIILLVFIQY